MHALCKSLCLRLRFCFKFLLASYFELNEQIETSLNASVFCYYVEINVATNIYLNVAIRIMYADFRMERQVLMRLLKP